MVTGKRLFLNHECPLGTGLLAALRWIMAGLSLALVACSGTTETTPDAADTEFDDDSESVGGRGGSEPSPAGGASAPSAGGSSGPGGSGGSQDVGLGGSGGREMPSGGAGGASASGGGEGSGTAGSGGNATSPSGLYLDRPVAVTAEARLPCNSAENRANAFLGNRDLQPDIQIFVRKNQNEGLLIKDDDMVPLIRPNQGGRIILAGVKVTNIGKCQVKIQGSLRDENNQQVRLDSRTVNLDLEETNGWGTSRLRSDGTFANVPVCPNQWATQDVFGKTFVLTVTVVDKGGRTATASTRVVPACPPADGDQSPKCACECKQGYQLGQSCP